MKYLPLIVLIFAAACGTTPGPVSNNVEPMATPDVRPDIEKAVKAYLAEAAPTECPNLKGVSIQERDKDIYLATRDCGGTNIDYLLVQRFTLDGTSYWKASLAEKEWLVMLGLQNTPAQR